MNTENQNTEQNIPQEQPAYQPQQPQQAYYAPQPQYMPPLQAPQDTLGKWVGVLFVAGIPIVGLIMLFVWGFGNSAPGIKNYARAALIWKAIGTVLLILFWVIFAGSIAQFAYYL